MWCSTSPDKSVIPSDAGAPFSVIQSKAHHAQPWHVAVLPPCQRTGYQERTRETEAIKVGSNTICREKPRRERRGSSWLGGPALSPPKHWHSDIRASTGAERAFGRPSPPAAESVQMGNCVTSGSQRSAVLRGPRKPLLSSGESGELQGTQSSPTSVAFKRTSQVRFPFSEASTYAGEGGS